MDLHSWLTFAVASFVMGVIPGPGVAAIVGFAFGSGRRVALAAVVGMAVGNAMAISLSLAGAGAVLASSALAFAVLKWAGAAYLVTVGAFAIARSGRAGTGDARGPSRPVSPRLAFASTVAVGTFHPKTILFFIAFAAQFIRTDAPYLPQAALLVATFTGVAAATDTAYALLASRASSLFGRPGVRRWAERAGGATLVAAGMATAAMRR